MRKNKSLLFEFFTMTTILISGQRVLANEDLKTVEQKDQGKDWIEEIKEKIKAIEHENEGKDWIEEIKEEIKAIEHENEGKNWIKEFKEEAREVDQESNIKDVINTEKEKKKQVSRKKIFEEIGTGLSEKGIYLDFLKNSKAKNTFGIRVNYLPEDFFTHKNIYVDDRNVKAEYFGIGMLYQRYLLPKESRSNFYLQANADISSLKLSHNIDLSKESRTVGNVVTSCSSCGILTIETNPNAVYLIPSLSLGYQYKISENFKTNISAGIQYLNPSNLEYHLSEGAIPNSYRSWMDPRINNYVEKSQKKIDNYSEFQPSINVGFSYSF